MEFKPENSNDVDSWKEVNLVYNSALKEINTKLEILNDEFQHVHQYNPIEHIKSRIKTPESIVKKLRKNGYEKIELGVFEFNKRAIKFYEKIGYEKITSLENFTYYDGKWWNDYRYEKKL